jgi:hypothetical protein
MQTNKVSDDDFINFMAAAREKTTFELGYEIGQRYARIFVYDYPNKGNRSVLCFIDLTNGNALRPDGWKRPNLKVSDSIQGNIYDEHKGSGAMRAGGRLHLRELA